MGKKLFKALVELYELTLRGRKDDRMGRVASTGTTTIDDLIAIAVARRTDLSPQVMKASYELLRAIAIEELCNSKNVEFGLTNNRLGARGVFIGDHPGWDSSLHSLFLIAITSPDVREAIKEILVEVLGMAQSGAFINSITDVSSGIVNEKLTPGGGANIVGSKIKIVGESPDVIGIRFTEIDTGTVTKIPQNAILTNEPSKISFVIPASLASGHYHLSVTTQYGSGSFLKEPRICTFDHVLYCD
jgi:hypothetical protein